MSLAQFTSTKTMFVQEAGPIRLTSTFLSPILPSSDLISHSLPFSYLHIALSSLDSKPHKVELYSDISGEWVSGDSDSVIEWGVEGLGRGRGKDGGEEGEEVLLQRLRVKDQVIFEERNDMAQYGEMIWATKAFKVNLHLRLISLSAYMSDNSLTLDTRLHPTNLTR